MPWTNQNGGGRGPWGQGPRGGGEGPGEPSDLDDMIRRLQDRMKSFLPPDGFGNRRGAGFIAGGIFFLWLCMGIYQVDSSEQGVVTRFGEFVRLTGEGLNYHLPYPFEAVVKVPTTTNRQLDVGVRSNAAVDSDGQTISRDIAQESLMLTGDENIADVDFTVFWQIKNAPDYLFNVENPDATLRAVAEAAMREVVGRSRLEPLLTEQRQEIAEDVRHLMQQVLDQYGAGIEVTQVQSQNVDPPEAVLDAFRDVQAAQADKERTENEALAYQNDVEPKARGEAQKILRQAQAYMEQSIAEAKGESSRFNAVREEYARAPRVTRERIYLETMERVLAGVDKVIIDGKGGTNVLPYLPLPEIQKRIQGKAEGAQ